MIELIKEEEALTTEIQQADEYRESIHSYLLKIEAALRLATPPTGGATAPVDVSKTAPSTSTTVKLPRLKLKAFAGDLTQWTPFWESFEAAVHTNVHLTPVEKFNYLNSVVEGPAQEAIADSCQLRASGNYSEEALREQTEDHQQAYGCHAEHRVSSLLH